MVKYASERRIRTIKGSTTKLFYGDAILCSLRLYQQMALLMIRKKF